MYDYTGDMEVFQRRLAKHGITREELDMTNYCGLTYRQLVGVVNSAIAAKEAKDKKEVANG